MSAFLGNDAEAVIRVDAGAAIGAGHFMRCLALASALSKQGVKTSFLINKETESFLKRRSDFFYDYYLVDCVDEIESIQDHTKKINLAFFIIDGYQFNERYRCSIRALCDARLAKLVVLDDLNNSGNLYAAAVINPVNEAFNMGYELSAPNASLFLGSDYVLLRPEFSKPDADAFSLGHQRNQCVITFGASDVAGFSLPLLNSLIEDSVLFDDQGSNASLLAVTGLESGQMKAVKLLSEQHPQKLKHAHNVLNMAEVMKNARCVISAAGGTVFELAALGLPSILVVVADNQLNAAKEQEKNGWCVVIDARRYMESGASKQKSIEEMVSVLRSIWNNQKNLHEMHKKAVNSAVYHGAEKVVTGLLAL